MKHGNKFIEKPAIFLGLEGVVGPHMSPEEAMDAPMHTDFELRKVDSYNRYAPEVVERLGLISTMQLVLCTDLIGLDLQLFTRKPGLRGLPKIRPTEARVQDELVRKKFDKICNDRVQSRMPFVWVNDRITRSVHDSIETIFEYVPHLTIQTNPRVGMTREHLERIEDFAQENTS